MELDSEAFHLEGGEDFAESGEGERAVYHLQATAQRSVV